MSQNCGRYFLINVDTPGGLFCTRLTAEEISERPELRRVQTHCSVHSQIRYRSDLKKEDSTEKLTYRCLWSVWMINSMPDTAILTVAIRTNLCGFATHHFLLCHSSPSFCQCDWPGLGFLQFSLMPNNQLCIYCQISINTCQYSSTRWQDQVT